MSPDKQRRTFLSYSRINKDFALKLAKELKASGFPVWIDQLDIPTGARWDDELEKALQECEIFMVILTPASSASDNVKDEIGYAIDTNKRILPILLENANVPLRLRRFQYVDFSNKSYEEGVESAKALLRSLTETPTGFYPRVTPEEVTASKPEATPAKKTSSSLSSNKGLIIGLGALLGVGVLVGIIVLVIAMLGSSGGSNAAAPVASTQIVVVTSTNQPEPTKAPQKPASAPSPTKKAEPTATTKVNPTAVPNSPTPGVQKYFTEDFNGDSKSWSTFVVDARKNDPLITNEDLGDISVGIENGLYLFNIQLRQVFVYSVYDPFEYDDVRVDARIDTRNNTLNVAKLICRYSPGAGWYEFSIINNGLYNIYYAKPNANGVVTYRSIANGGSEKVNVGNAVNEYSIVCQGNELSLFANGNLVKATSDDLSVLRTGKVGVSVASNNLIPVDAGYDWVKISEPK